MKLIKSLILAVSILVCGLCFAGCDNSESSSIDTRHGDSSTVDKDSLSSTEKQAVMDSISKLEVQIKAIDESVKTHDDGISDLKKTASDAKLWFYIALGIAVLSLSIAVICIIRLIKLNERADRHRNDIEELRMKISNTPSCQQNSQQLRQTSNVGNEYYSLAARVQTLEQTIAKEQSSKRSHNVVQQVVPVQPKHAQIGYFGVPSQMSQTEAYFRKLIESASDSDVRFSATVRCNRAEFEPKEGMISSLKSSDTMKLAVETTGCLLSDATSMKTIKPGEAELRDSRWVITKKALIHLQK